MSRSRLDSSVENYHLWHRSNPRWARPPIGLGKPKCGASRLAGCNAPDSTASGSGDRRQECKSSRARVLAVKSTCGRCAALLGSDAPAFACTHECTFCRACTDALVFRCPNCGGILFDRKRATIAVATATEALAVSRVMPGARVCETGVGLATRAGPFGESVVSCGLAGGLRRRRAERHRPRPEGSASSGRTHAAVRCRTRRTPGQRGAPLRFRSGNGSDAHRGGDRARQRAR